MNREKVNAVVEELLDILNQKKMSPYEAETIGEVFIKSIKESNERGTQEFLEKGEFHGNPIKI